MRSPPARLTRHALTLVVLGTDPHFQRRGVGRALLSNLAYYQRFGFAAIDSFTVDDSPPLWLMQREPR